MAVRTLSSTLAAVVEELELTQPTVVTTDLLRTIIESRGLGTTPNVVASRLRHRGWLLATDRRGVWEFAPGSHAGAIGHGDPTLPLQAMLATHPNLPAALALGSAAWALGYADRVPATLDVSAPPNERVSPALRRSVALTRFAVNTGYVTAKGVPCHRPESVIVHLAANPGAPRSWGAVLEWLPDLAADVSGKGLAAELAGRHRSVGVRAGYLLSGLRPDLAVTLAPLATSVVRFGPREGEPRRHVPAWQVIDYLLPSDPATWGLTR